MHKWANKYSGEWVTYQLEIKTKKNSSELVFEELWIDEKRYTFHLSCEERKIANIFEKKEKLKLNVISPINNLQEFPFRGKSSKGKFILYYSYKNKRKFISIKKFSDFEEHTLQS
jgi:hypothetical protein